MKTQYGRRASLKPKASAQRFHQSNGSRLDKTLLALRKHSRVLRHRRASADCFGANPVASALGNRPRRDPGAAVRTYHEGLKPTLKTGTFYLAGNRNFLFGSDTNVRQRSHWPYAMQTGALYVTSHVCDPNVLFARTAGVGNGLRSQSDSANNRFAPGSSRFGLGIGGTGRPCPAPAPISAKITGGPSLNSSTKASRPAGV